MKRPRAWWGTAAVLAGLVAWSFWRRYAFLAETPYPTGIDGYYYAVQLRSLLESGQLYYPSAPLAMWLMAPLAALTDPVVGAKLGAALGTSLLAVPVYLLGRRIGGGRAQGFLAAVLVVTSVESFYLATEFVKQGIGLTVAAGFLAALAAALERADRRRVAGAVLLFVAAALTHKMAAAVAVVFGAPPLALRLWRAESGRCALGRGAAAGVALLVVGAVLGALAPERFVGANDLAATIDMVSRRADWPPPALRLSPERALYFGHEVAIAGALGLAVLAVLALARRFPGLRPRTRPVDRAFAFGPAVLAIVLALPWLDAGDPDGLTYRLRLAAFVPLSLCAAAVAGAALVRLSSTVRTALVVGFAVGWFASRPAHFTEGLVRVHPAMQAAVRAARGVVPPDHVIITPQRQLVFMTAWYTGSYARLRPEPVDPERRWRLLPGRLVHPELGAAIERARREAPADVPRPRGLHPNHRNGLVLMPETTWRWVLEHTPGPVRARYERWVTI